MSSHHPQWLLVLRVSHPPTPTHGAPQVPSEVNPILPRTLNAQPSTPFTLLSRVLNRMAFCFESRHLMFSLVQLLILARLHTIFVLLLMRSQRSIRTLPPSSRSVFLCSKALPSTAALGQLNPYLLVYCCLLLSAPCLDIFLLSLL